MDSDKENFKFLLDYELRQCVRHRRYMSLVMMSLKNGHQKMIKVIRSRMRQSDVVSFFEGFTLVLMADADKLEAVSAAARYGNDFDGCLDIRCSVSTFPDDGKTWNELSDVSQRRMKKAMKLNRGAVVAK